MPQTLSLLGRGHNNNNNPAQNYIGNNQQQAAVTTQLQSNAGNQEANYRHGYSAVQQQQQQQQYPNQTAGIHASSPAAVYQVQNSSNLTGFHGTVATTFGNSSQKYNQSSQLSNSNDLVQNQDQNQVLNSQKVKFEPGKSQDKFEHALPPSNKHEQQQQNRYDQNLTSKYEPQQQSGKHDPVGIQAKHEQHLHNVKYESGSQNSQQYGKHEQQQQHEGRLPIKYDHNSTFKHEPSTTSQYKAEYKPEPNKYDNSGQSKFETMPTKYEQNSTTKHVVDHVIAKFEIPAKTPYEFDNRPTTKGNDGERKNFNESRMDDKTKPALPPKPSKPNPPPRLTHHEKIDVPSSEGINEGKMTNTNLNSRFVYF